MAFSIAKKRITILPFFRFRSQRARLEPDIFYLAGAPEWTSWLIEAKAQIKSPDPDLFHPQVRGILALPLQSTK
jgi:hypothetical protein